MRAVHFVYFSISSDTQTNYSIKVWIQKLIEKDPVIIDTESNSHTFLFCKDKCV